MADIDVDALIARLRSLWLPLPVSHASVMTLMDAAAAIAQMRERITALVATLHTEQDRTHRYLDRAKRAEAERDAAVQDAERYRWLRDNAEYACDSFWADARLVCEITDAAIDAARKGKA